MKAAIAAQQAAPQPDAQVAVDRMRALGDDPTKLREAAQQFEAMVLNEIMKPLVETSGMLEGGVGSDIARSMFHESIIEKVAEGGGVGLADAVIQSLGRSHGIQAYGPAASPAGSYAWPLPGIGGDSMGSNFGMRSDPFTHEQRMHKGLDVSAPTGTAVHPLRGGTVAFAGERGGYGNVVYVDHGDGLQTRYGHLHQVDVQVGDRVDIDHSMGTVGSTGRSTGPHLHLEVRRDGEAVDPRPLLERGP
jgi:murein DD-endopeptidase MepM/ murein hydrolase activator NlpD